MPRIRVTAKQLGDRHFQVNLTGRIAVITQSLLRPGKGGRLARVKAIYLGFDSHDQAMSAANDLKRRFPKSRIEVRKAERLETAYEVKFAHECAEQLAWQMLEQIPTTSQRIEQHIQTHRKFIEARAQQDRFSAPVSKPTRRTMVQAGARLIGID